VNWTGNTPPQILITPQAFQKLRLYIDLCPMEIGGLGEVERDGHRFLITDLFILPQKVSPAETELDPAAMLEILECCVAEGRNPASLCLWWHSHAEMDLEWSETDIMHSNGQTLGDLSLTILPSEGTQVDEAVLRNAIIAEMCEKLQVITKDLQFHEIPVEVEFLSPFPPNLCPPESPSSSVTDDR
jgi:proteasome lid subunit RPN8/RPN11